MRNDQRNGNGNGRRMRHLAAVALVIAAMIAAGCGSTSSSSSDTAAESLYTEATSSGAARAYDSTASADSSYDGLGSSTIDYGSSNTLAEAAPEDTGETEILYREGEEDNQPVASDTGEAVREEEQETTGQDDATQQIQKKIVYTGDVSLQTKDYDTARQQLADLVSRDGGFVESSSEYDYGSDTQKERTYYVTVRIPSTHFDDFMNGLGDVSGKVTSKNISSEDMTRTYSDNADRIEALETEQKTLLELLAKADSVDAMIAIQKELTDVRTELAQLHHANSSIDHDVRYSSVSITLEEVVTYMPTQTGFGERLQDAFGDSGESFVAFLQNLLIALIYLIPYIVIVVVIVLILRKIRKNRKKKKAAKAENAVNT